MLGFIIFSDVTKIGAKLSANLAGKKHQAGSAFAGMQRFTNLVACDPASLGHWSCPCFSP